jgi:uncharacterized OsmC-like protein
MIRRAEQMAQSDIAAAIAAARSYLQANPADARYRDSPAAARIETGLRIRADGPDGASVATDMVAAVGGGGTAPSPGWLFRAAYASCVATLVAMRAAERGVALSALEVTVDSQSDDRGILGIDDGVPAGPLSMRVVIRIRAASDAAILREVVDWGVAHCPLDDLVRRPVPVEVEVQTG